MKKQKQKKILVVAALALMIALVSGMGAMTYARYISSAKVDPQQATAAKWGFVVTADTSKLFSTDYTLVSGQYATPTTLDNGVAVNAHADTVGNIVAPGTSGSMTISVSGVSEVLAKLTLKVDDGSKDIKLDSHKPIKWTLNKKVGDSAAADVDGAVKVDFATLVTKLAAESAVIPAGTEKVVTYTISWVWEFDVDSATNIKDTIIGFKSAGVAYAALSTTYDMNGAAYSTHISGDNYNSADYISTTLSFSMSITVEQIQTNA